MTSFSDFACDERRARMVLSMLTEPDDAVTGRLLGRLGAVKTVGLLDGDGKVPGLGRVDARVWRDRLTAARPDELAGRLRHAEAARIGVVIPGDRDWPAALTAPRLSATSPQLPIRARGPRDSRGSCETWR